MPKLLRQQSHLRRCGDQFVEHAALPEKRVTAFDPPLAIPFRVENPWFTGAADVPTFSQEEILATKLRALLQRDKGRDLFDLARALEEFDGLDTARLVACFAAYLGQTGQTLSRAQAYVRQARESCFLIDMRPLLPAAQAVLLTDDSARSEFQKVSPISSTSFPASRGFGSPK